MGRRKLSKWAIYGFSFLAASLVALHLSGCSKRYQDLPAFSAIPFRDSENQSVGRFKTSYLADQIHAYFRGSTAGPIAVTTFVDVDNLYQSSTFGRILSEQLMSELAMLGYNVVEMRQAEAMQIMYDQGELGLSRDINTLRKNHDLSAIVVGTYAVSPVRVYVNARLLEPKSSLVVSVGSVEMQKTGEIARLLRVNTSPQTLERIPVRHLGYTVMPAPAYFPYSIPYWYPQQPGWGGARPYGDEEDETANPPVITPQGGASDTHGAPVEAPTLGALTNEPTS